MKISLINAGKRFNRDWIFRNIQFEFTTGVSYAITGPNGSGKSTLLQAIGGALMLSEGKIEYGTIATDAFYQHVSVAAPYLEVIEEMTVTEFLEFHQQFKSFLIKPKEMIDIVGLQKAAHKQIRYYSSGMKQRVKLAQAFFSDVPVILLDEPCTNLDAEGIALYHQLVNDYTINRLVIVSSNDPQEYSFCQQRLSITDFKS